MVDYKFDVQLLIEGEGLSDEKITDYITRNIVGNCLLVVGDEQLIKIHFHTDYPWRVLQYCASMGDIHDIVVENMVRQASGRQG
ncbi:MAG: kinase to dihydroxyacetone kinase [Clostridiaceae bacterium]|nr:kinase to dihydroxyacetone kinase [Clostridiaceae bacterium]